ncbi:hypothetical protein HAX54_015113, partial [Datura stramonium]|nr:hypothetical protein [Datura stramonium]
PLRDTGETLVPKHKAPSYRKREAKERYESGEAGVRLAKCRYHFGGLRSRISENS